MELLKKLTEIRAAASDEAPMRDFIIDYVKSNSANWKTQPELVYGKGFQDCLILVFGEPRTSIYAHMDSIGFSVGYEKDLIKVGGARTIDGMELVGSDSQGEIETELIVIETEEHKSIQYVSDRVFDRGTLLTFKPNFRETEQYIQSPYLDNRLGVWNALKVAETLENGAIVFSTYEEHGGNSVGFCAKYLFDKYQLTQNLISDITWVTNGVKHGGGVAISMRDKGLPRRSFLESYSRPCSGVWC